jgi:hypothetical protein
MVCCGECRQLIGISADEQQIGHQPVTIAQLETALGGNRQEVRHVLGGAHASSGTIDDDADATVDERCGLRTGAVACRH